MFAFVFCVLFPVFFFLEDVISLFLKVKQRAHSISTEKATISATDEDSIADVMEQHDEFLSSMLARSAKLQVLMILLIVFTEFFEFILICVSAICYMITSKGL